MKKLVVLALFLAPWLVHSAVKNVIPLSTNAQMQGGNSLSAAVPGSAYAIQASWTGASLAGSIAVQASLDNTNWFTVSSTSQSVSGSGSYLWNISSVGYPFAQLLYTVSSTNSWTVAPTADPGKAQLQNFYTVTDTCKTQLQVITTKADVNGSLNNRYFLVSGFNTGKGSRQDYYVWFNISGKGNDPLVTGRTGVQITAATGTAASTLATSIATGLKTISNSFATVTTTSSTISITANNCGATPAASDGPVFSNQNTGFNFLTPYVTGADSNLNNTYFTISAIDSTTKAQKDFYVWYNTNGKGTDPLVSGKTAVAVTVAAGGTVASTVASSTATALAALSTDFTTATSTGATVAVTNAKVGAVPAAADSSFPTRFTFLTPYVVGVNSLNNKYFTFYSANNAVCYYLWINVDSLGTDPALAGCTAAPITDSHGDSASTIGGKITTAIAALNATNSFTTGGTTLVTVTNKASGPSTFPVDFGTGFTFSGSFGSGTLSSFISY